MVKSSTKRISQTICDVFVRWYDKLNNIDGCAKLMLLGSMSHCNWQQCWLTLSGIGAKQILWFYICCNHCFYCWVNKVPKSLRICICMSDGLIIVNQLTFSSSHYWEYVWQFNNKYRTEYSLSSCTHWETCINPMINCYQMPDQDKSQCPLAGYFLNCYSHHLQE